MVFVDFIFLCLSLAFVAVLLVLIFVTSVGLILLRSIYKNPDIIDSFIIAANKVMDKIKEKLRDKDEL